MSTPSKTSFSGTRGRDAKSIIITHLYPREMNIYGDRGNIMVLQKRLRWHGYNPVVEELNPSEPYDFTRSDILFGGGGQDQGQVVVADDLAARADVITTAIKSGASALLICGTYQLFGHSFTTLEGQHLVGIGVFDLKTVGSTQRMIGNIVVETSFGRLVGFENHSGQTQLGSTQAALGKVVKGFGNNSYSGQEGAVSFNAYGTYLHGPILSKNPQLADLLIGRAVDRKYGGAQLKTLDDQLEFAAADIAATRPR